MPVTARVSVRIASVLQRRLRQEASRNGESESQVIRKALERYFTASAPRQTCYDLARRVGLLGCVRNAPPDLSVSRKHFEGFGTQ